MRVLYTKKKEIHRGYLYKNNGGIGMPGGSWNLPGNAHFVALISALGVNGWGVSAVGGMLKSTLPGSWNAPNTGATNSIGFNAVATGYRTAAGVYYGEGQLGHIWCLTQSYNVEMRYKLWLQWDSADTFWTNSENKGAGLPIRLINQNWPQWQPGDTVIGYTGIKYKTIKVGNVVWMAENLRETNDIPLITDNDEWAAASFGRCAYNNDMTNV
jgi:uncharacterized protein (TIGR02145 family)